MRIEKFRKQILVLLCLAGVFSYAATGLTQEAKQSKFELFKTVQRPDVAKFEIEFFNLASEIPGQSRVIFKLSFVNDELQFIRTKKKIFQADYEIRAMVFDTSGTEIDQSKIEGSVKAQNFDETNSVQLINSDYVSMDIPPGTYRFRIELKDMETRRSGVREGRITLRDFPADEIAISDVFLLDSLEVSEKNNDDNALSQIRLYAFFEVYNISEPDSFDLFYELLAAEDKIVEKDQQRIKSKPRVRHYIDLSDLAFLGKEQQIRITLKADTISKVFVKPLSRPASDPGPAYNDLATAIEQLRYIARDKELEKMQSLEGDEQVKAFEEFWSSRDPDPTTRLNEYKEEYYRRVSFANKAFSSPAHKDGWKTEMGRVFIKLGPPDYVDGGYDPLGTSMADELRNFRRRPYILWVYYSLQEQVIFEYKITEYRIYNYYDVYDILNGEMVL